MLLLYPPGPPSHALWQSRTGVGAFVGCGVGTTVGSAVGPTEGLGDGPVLGATGAQSSTSVRAVRRGIGQASGSRVGGRVSGQRLRLSAFTELSTPWR